ncbi:cathepsin W-like [Discoglossus pictus]
MSVLCALSVVAGLSFNVVSGSSEMETFENFMLQFNKSYKSREEFQYRKNIFLENLKEATRLQSEELGTARYGVTQFSDLTGEEFRSYHLDPRFFQNLPPLKRVTVDGRPSKSCDWRKMGVISEAKHQGSECHSCWAFASVADIEAHWGIAGFPRNLSVQQVIDCSRLKEPCVGGYAWDAYITVQQQSGLTDEHKYRYTGKMGACKKNFKAEGYINDFNILQGNEKVMASHLANKGTLTVTVNRALLKYYMNGIINPTQENCKRDVVDHVVLIVGYGEGRDGAFWILKNSWGKMWGENGFFMLVRGKNACGINKYPVTAVVDFGKKNKQLCPP